MSTLLSVSEIIHIPPGDKDNPSWIAEGGFAGLCRKVEMKTYGAGKKMWPCVIGDENSSDTLEVTFFMTPKFQEGDRVEFTGKGMRRTAFNGKPQVAIGKDTVVSVSAGRPRVQAAAHGAVAEKANGEMISGQTVGMAMKEALSLVVGREGAPGIETPEFWACVHATASDIIRVSRLLEAGKLAAPIRERSHQQPVSRPAGRPQHDPEAELSAEAEVPF